MHLFLYPLTYIFQSPCDVTDDMKSVNHQSGIGKQVFCNIPVNMIHIRDDIFDVLPVRELQEIMDNVRLFSGRKDIEQCMPMCICKDCLKFLSARVSPEFVDRKDSRKFLRSREVDQVKKSENRGV